MTDLSEDQLNDVAPLNQVRAPFPCPKCGHAATAEVFVTFFRWGCGHRTPLPATGFRGRPARGAREPWQIRPEEHHG